MYLACPNCKFIKISWKDEDQIFTNHVLRTKEQQGITCEMCFAEMKVVTGEPPKTCHHSRPLTANCNECKQIAYEKLKENHIELRKRY